MVPASPSISMVPLDSDEDIGEVADGVSVSNYPGWKSALKRSGGRTGIGQSTAITFVHP